MDMKDTLMSDASLLKDCLSLEESRVLQLRLDNLSQDWKVVESRLPERVCQLKFEWSQTVSYMYMYLHVHCVAYYMYSVCDVVDTHFLYFGCDMIIIILHFIMIINVCYITKYTFYRCTFV